MDGNGSIPMVQRRGSGSTSRSLLATVAVLALALVASCGGQFGSGGGRPAGDGGREAPAEKQAVGPPALGDANAPVVLTEYADYQ